MSDSKRSADLPAGYDESDPYEDVDIEEYPEWWKKNIVKFRKHNMRPYRPPRFNDDEMVPEVVNELQEQNSIDIKFRIRNPQSKERIRPNQAQDWEITVDGKDISTIRRYRTSEGYSVYDMSSDEFEQLIEEGV